MTRIVDRTCTALYEQDRLPVMEGRSLPLERFRDSDAWVLLGPPGSGKTTVFRRAAKYESGCYVSARDFKTFDDKPEWHDATLYIDGLDEMRAGSSDGREALDGIRAKLYSLGRPRFRLSCREADWFRANDRDALKSVSRSETIEVLRLDPLSDVDIREILQMNEDIDDPNGFIESVHGKGIGGLLSNPQALELLVTAVKAGSNWPETRTETFKLACERLVRETNQEHRCAQPNATQTTRIVNAAGRLCAIQLLTGSIGFDQHGDERRPDVIALDRIAEENPPILRQVLGSKLFEWSPEGVAAPVHRGIAEFLAAKYIHGLLERGLPFDRVLALMKGYDGGIVSAFRGLSAWLAALDKSNRTEIIKRDPLGVVLYGDAKKFSVPEKEQVFEELLRLGKMDRKFSLTLPAVAHFGDLATPDMEESFRQHLMNPSQDPDRQIRVFCIITALGHGSRLSALVDLLPNIVRDKRWPQSVRHTALDAFFRNTGNNSTTSSVVDALLNGVYDGSISDPDDDLLGTLLSVLYPNRLSVGQVLKYLRPPKSDNFIGNYYWFWTRWAPENSTIRQLAEFLDVVSENFDAFRAVFVDSPARIITLSHVPFIWLKHFLERSQENPPTDRLVRWLEMAGDPELRATGEEAEFVKRWLECHPATVKDIFRQRVELYSGTKHFSIDMFQTDDLLLGAKWPDDFGLWCLEQTFAAGSPAEADWFMERVANSLLNGRYSDGLTREAVERRLAGNASLLNVFARKIDNLEGDLPSGTGSMKEQRPEVNQRRLDWRRCLERNEAALRENKCSPQLLHTLAQTYFDEFAGISGQTPQERLQDLTGAGATLIEDVIEGFRQSIRRADAPDATGIFALYAQHQINFLALPILAGLEEATRMPATGQPFRNRSEMELALAVHFTTPTSWGAAPEPEWFLCLLKSQSGLVADSLIRSVRSKMKLGREIHEDTYGLAHLESHSGVAQQATLPLLRAMPTRCTVRQLLGLGFLLQSALLHCDRTALLSLIEKKLAYRSMNVGQRVYWLGAAFLASPEHYGDALEAYVTRNDRCIRHLARFVAENRLAPALTVDLEVSTLAALIHWFGSSYGCGSPVYRPRQIRDEASLVWDCIRAFIDRLGSTPTSDATRALRELTDAPRLREWHPYLADASYQQSAVRREVSFRHCELERVVEALNDGRPANAADLHALITETLGVISRNVRDGNASGWKTYWNIDGYNRPLRPVPENACRDRLAEDLKRRLHMFGIDVLPEGHYANDKRADIRISLEGFNVPIEIKRSCDRNLWSALGNQLLAKYSRDSEADGHGIYLVFWFGDADGCKPTHGPDGQPRSASDLQTRLSATLPEDEISRISICVVDVSKPVD